MLLECIEDQRLEERFWKRGSGQCVSSRRERREELDDSLDKGVTGPCESALWGPHDGDIWELGGVPGRDVAKFGDCTVALSSGNFVRDYVAQKKSSSRRHESSLDAS